MYSYSNMRGGYLSTELKPKEADQPLDTVSCIIWDAYREEPGFVTASWDGYLRYYMIKSNGDVDKVWQIFLQHPVLSCDISENNVVFGGLATGDVVAVSLENSGICHLGKHDAPINGIFWIRQKGCLITTGFDNLLKIWSLQAGPNFQQMEYKMPQKTITSSYDFPYLVIGTLQGLVAIVTVKNLPNINAPASTGDYLKTTIDKFSRYCSSRVISSVKKVVMGTIDGRCLYFTIKQIYTGFEMLEPIVSRSQKRTDHRVQMYGQVNAVDIGVSNYDPFTIIGGSEDCSGYNLYKKNRIKSYSQYGTTVGATTAVRLHPKLQFIAVATGSDWLKGLNELQSIKKPKITVYRIDGKDLKDFVAR